MPVNSDFCKAEYRDGFFVDKERKKVWAVELDLLELLISICEKHGIKYFAIGGTLLGAARHKGFIPWDDDIDIGMLRKDYDRFLKVCEEELNEPYFLQTTLTDDCYRAHAQIRNSNTTGYAVMDENLHCNKGIFIDIFPLDGIPDSQLLYRLQMLRMKTWNRLFMNYYYFDVVHGNPGFAKSLFHLGVCAFFRLIGTKRAYRHYDRIASQYSKKPTTKVGELTILFDDERYHWRRSYFRTTIKLPFEHLQLSVPKDYIYFLRTTFGNYHVIPENKMERALHGEMVFDPDTPFNTHSNSQTP